MMVRRWLMMNQPQSWLEVSSWTLRVVFQVCLLSHEEFASQDDETHSETSSCAPWETMRLSAVMMRSSFRHALRLRYRRLQACKRNG
jgi:hypothetical protein